MKITPLGAAQEVGRSAFLVKGAETNLLLDYGAMTFKDPQFPLHVSPREVDAILLSHAHLDHSGGLPMFYLNGGKDLYASALTTELTHLLIEDFLKISGFYLPFERPELVSMMKYMRNVNLDEGVKIGEFTATYREAGHIPGGASILLETNNKRLLYTGDINAIPTQLIRGAHTDFGELDFIITESTYATGDHPSREEVERELVGYAKQVVERGGVLLIPAFSVGRSQEIACVLKSHKFPYTVAMDGMALKTNEIFMRHQEDLANPKLFRDAIAGVEIMTNWYQRRRIVETPSVIIAPAGMLSGGSSVFYNKMVTSKTKNGVALVSFQAPGTPGRTLMEKKVVIVNGKPRKIKSEVRKFDFSSHSGKKELFEMFSKIGGEPKVLTIHGDSESCVTFAEDLKEKFGFDVAAPKAGETFEV